MGEGRAGRRVRSLTRTGGYLVAVMGSAVLLATLAPAGPGNEPAAQAAQGAKAAHSMKAAHGIEAAHRIEAAHGPKPALLATYTTTPADLTAGVITNTVTATYSSLGQLITYRFLVTNTSAVPLSSITVNASISPVTCPQPTLGPGASETCTATYLITAPDLDAGSVTNTTTAQGNPPGSTVPIVSSPVTATVILTAVQAPAITVAKSARPDLFTAAGQVIHYSYLVTNTGDVALSDVNVNDTEATVTCPDTTLAAGVSETCTATHTITTADLDVGFVINLATAQGLPSGSTTPVVSSPSIAVVSKEEPAIALYKTAAPAMFEKAGQLIHYTYHVFNSGNVTLDDVTVTDTRNAVSCPKATLAEGESEVCTASYTITAADFKAGKVTNTATAQGLPSGLTTLVVSTPSTVTIRAGKPSIKLVKSAAPTMFGEKGQLIRYTYRVTNTGNVALASVRIRDTNTAVSCPKTTLAPGASETCTATYHITSADMKARSVTNHAVAEAVPPVSSQPAAVTIVERVPVTG